MSAPAFTKGPWFGDGREKETGEILVYAPEAKHGCRDICFIPEDDAQDVANARLIAAAPELYEALEQLLRSLSPAEQYAERLPIVGKAEAALAKARAAA